MCSVNSKIFITIRSSKSTLRLSGARSLIPNNTIIPLIRYESYPYFSLTIIVPWPQIVNPKGHTQSIQSWLKVCKHFTKRIQILCLKIYYMLLYTILRFWNHTIVLLKITDHSTRIVYFQLWSYTLLLMMVYFTTQSTLTLILIWPLSSFEVTLTLICN